MSAMYRGAGPDVGRFDFTPACYEDNCSRSDLPAAFSKQCRSAKPTIEILKQQINCIAEPDHEKCAALMSAAARRKAADDLLYDECKRLGEDAFNRRHGTEPAMQRSNDCAYEKRPTGGPNSMGQKWRRLLDGACRSGNFVGKNGLDCCSGNLFATAMLGSECRGFFIKK